VEEQFYLVFPLVLIACVRWRRQAMLPVVAGLGLLSFALALWLAEHWPQGSFYLLPSRLWEFAVGAGIALLARRPAPRLLPALGGLALIAAGYALIRPGTPAPGAMFLLPTLGAALVILFAAPANAAGRVLAWRPLVWLGLVSFGTYLWHQPLLVFAHYLWFGPLPLPVLAGLVAGSVGLGALSYHLLEQPVRAGRLLASRPALLWAAAAGLAVPAAAGVAGHFRWLLPASGPEMERLGALQFEDPGPEVVPPNGPLPYVLFGDSHAAHYRHALAERFGAGALLSQPSCLAAPGVSHAREELDPARCRELPDRLVRLVRERGVRTVIWSQLWARQIFAEGAREPLSLEAGAKALTGGMQHLADRLPQGTRIILIGNVPGAWPAGPQVAGGWPRCRAYLNAQCPAAFPTRKAQGKAINAALRAFAARDRRFIYVDSAAPLCPGDRCLVLQDGALNYWDPHHLTLAGARRVVATMPALPPATLP
jgi:hypothetical protein